jgi:mannosyltransferase
MDHFSGRRMGNRRSAEVDVIVPNLHWRYSGVTAANRMVAPHLGRTLAVAWFGRDAPDGVRRLSLRELLALRFSGQRPCIWHARPK